MPKSNTHKINGQLEIDYERGVIYFHDTKGTTKMRMQGLPTPINLNTSLLDIRVQPDVSCSWEGEAE